MVADENDLVIRVSGEQAGGQKGQLILNDVTFGGERDNTVYHGIGHDEPQDLGRGNKSYTLSHEQVLNEAAARLLVELVENDSQPDEAEVRAAGVLKANIGKIDWNSFDWEASDGGDVTISIDCDCRDVELLGPSSL